jgi:hypothetical protein
MKAGVDIDKTKPDLTKIQTGADRKNDHHKNSDKGQSENENSEFHMKVSGEEGNDKTENINHHYTERESKLVEDKNVKVDVK